ncbi:MAG: type I 3-dehydroquinate dehydratase [Candidatus Helarchaeota archaeon]
MICVAISASNTDSAIDKSHNAISKGATLVEIRLDYFEAPNAADVIKLVQKIPSKVILTVRKPGEGGKYPFVETDRIKLIQKCITANPHAIDLEFSIDDETLTSLITLARQQQVKVILSHHNFESTPPVEAMKTLILNAAAKKAHYIKIIGTATCVEDNLKMLSLPQIAAENKIQIIAFSMGLKGIISRILSPIFGAAFTFASLDEPTAPGQIQIEDMKRNLEQFTTYFMKE